MIQRLQYISQGQTPAEHLQAIQRVLQSGCTWIQLRVKEQPEEEVLKLAQKARLLTRQYGAILIINDYPVIARQVEADGVHLGLQDMPVNKARAFLGSDFIIGGTANTLEQVREQIRLGADYVGVGPYRFTTTKKKLSPIVGPEGYPRILSQLSEEERRIPIIAVGGIQRGDVPALLEVGVYGVAVSGAITQPQDPAEVIQQFQHILNSNKDVAHSR